jgi:hypothetical protein
LFFNQEEARASSQEEQQQEGTAGLKVFVDLYHNRRGSAELCVHSFAQDLGCKTINLSQYPSSPVRSGPWTFSPEIVEVGETFRVCVTNLNTGGQSSRCINGTNSPEKEPEYVSLTVPRQSSGVPKQGVINWGEVCRHPFVDPFIREPCHTLTTRDGYTLTPEGIRVIRCIAAGLVLLIYDPSEKTLAAARALGPAVNCG